MFNWFRWKKDAYIARSTDKPLEYKVDSMVLDSMLDSSIAKTKEISAKIISKLEDKLEDREMLLGEVFNTIDGVLCLKDPQGRWKLLNKFGKKLYGLEGVEYKELTNNEVAQVAARYAAGLHQCNHTDDLAWAARDTITIEERSLDTFGKELILHVTKTPIFDGEDKRYLLVHAVDVTEEYENNRHITMLVKALDQASDAIFVCNHKHSIIYANQAYVSCTGYTLKEILGQKASFVSPTDSTIEINLTDTVVQGETWQGAVVSKHKDGSNVGGILTVTPVLNGKPYPIYYIGVKRLVK